MADLRSLRAEAVVLQHSDFGEADRLLTLYTREHGKVRAIVKGARKIASRKAGHLEPFTRVRLQLARGRDLMIVTQAETVEAYPALREDLTLTGYAAYVLELLDRFVPDEQIAVPSLYRLLTETLSRLATESIPWLTVRSYEMRLLDLLGFRPQLFECANCGKEIVAEAQFFSAALGGAVCPNCGRGLPGLWSHLGGGAEVPAPLPAQRVPGCGACPSRRGGPGGDRDGHAGIFPVPAGEETEHAGVYEEGEGRVRGI